MSAYQDSKCSCLWDYLVPFTRFWGVFTAVVLCGVGTDVTFHHHIMGVYVIVGSAIVFFLEVTWAVTLFLHVCLRNEYSPGLRCWEVVLWIDQWRKSVLYAAFSVLLFARPHRLWLSTVAGVMLVLLAVLYLVLSFRGRIEVKETALLHDDREESYDRFDDLGDSAEDILPATAAAAARSVDTLEAEGVILEM